MKKLSAFLIAIGLLVAVSPVVGNVYLQWHDSRLLDEWYNSPDTPDAQALMEADADVEESYGQLQAVFMPGSGGNLNNDEGIRDNEDANGTGDLPETGSAANSEDNPAPNSVDAPGNTPADAAATPAPAANPKPAPKPADTRVMLGVIKIDKIKVKYPVVEGVKASNLRTAIGHIPGSAGLGQPGNCALAGHRNYTFGRFFNRLDELNEGDIISVSTKKEEFIYKVYEKLVVTPDDVSVIKKKKGETILTLITCTPIRVATHRLIVHARLEETITLK